MDFGRAIVVVSVLGSIAILLVGGMAKSEWVLGLAFVMVGVITTLGALRLGMLGRNAPPKSREQATPRRQAEEDERMAP